MPIAQDRKTRPGRFGARRTPNTPSSVLEEPEIIEILSEDEHSCRTEQQMQAEQTQTPMQTEQTQTGHTQTEQTQTDQTVQSEQTGGTDPSNDDEVVIRPGRRHSYPHHTISDEENEDINEHNPNQHNSNQHTPNSYPHSRNTNRNHNSNPNQNHNERPEIVVLDFDQTVVSIDSEDEEPETHNALDDTTDNAADAVDRSVAHIADDVADVDHIVVDDDVVVVQETPARRRRTRTNPPPRNTRRRTHPDEDIEIIDERPAATRLRPRRDVHENFMRGDDERYRRQLLNRFQSGMLESPFGTFSMGDEASQMHQFSSLINNRGFNSNPLRYLGGIFSSSGPLGAAAAAANFGGENEIEASILARIERDNENRLDTRLQSENIYNRKALIDKKAIAENEHKGYTNEICADSVVGCELCGVALGEGIPDDFVPNPEYDSELAAYQKQYGVNAPWFCFKMCTPVDRDLSKRVFAARCGHVYCGRCFKNIGNRVQFRRKKHEVVSIENPRIYSPRNCVASECGNSFRGKTPFVEVFF